MLVIGLTGGFASGKSTVAKLFHTIYHIPIINADDIAKDLTQIGKPAYQEIIDYFGTSYLSSNQEINRSKLRDRILKNTQDKYWLEELLHPLIRQAIEQAVLSIKHQQPAAYLLVEIPLLIENLIKHKQQNQEADNHYAYLDRYLVVDISKEQQLIRAQQRNVPANIAQAIIQQQATRQQRLTLADDILLNDGNLDELTQRIERLHEQYSNTVI